MLGFGGAIRVGLAVAALLLAACVADRRDIQRSPYAVGESVGSQSSRDWNKLWAVLGVPSTLQTDLGAGPVRLDAELGTPEVALFPMQLSGSNHNLVLLRLAWSDRQVFRYVLFEREGESWHVAGFLDHGFAKYFEPTHHVEQVGGRRWLVFRVQTGSGTGFQQATQKWFEMANGQLRQVLTLVSDASQLAYPGSYLVEVDVAVTAYNRTDGGESLTAIYSARFGLEGADPSLGTVRKTAIYVRPRAGEAFQFDSAHSEITKEQIEQIFESYTLSPDEFLRFDLENLKKIIGTGQGSGFRWLKENLGRFKEFDEGRLLLRLMQESRRGGGQL